MKEKKENEEGEGEKYRGEGCAKPSRLEGLAESCVYSVPVAEFSRFLFP